MRDHGWALTCFLGNPGSPLTRDARLTRPVICPLSGRHMHHGFNGTERPQIVLACGSSRIRRYRVALDMPRSWATWVAGSSPPSVATPPGSGSQ